MLEDAQIGNPEKARWTAGLKLLALTLAAANALLLVLHLCIYWWHLIPLPFLWKMFDLGSECNVPTWFASILWFLVAMAALLSYALDLRAGKSSGNWIWLLIALAFVVASVDEVASLHEEVGSFLKAQARQPGLLSALPAGSPDSPWIVFYSPVLLAFSLVAGLFLWRRLSWSKWLRVCIVLAAECYLIAIGLDYFQGLPAALQQPLAIALDLQRKYLLETTIAVEEMLENIGTSLLLLALAAYAGRSLGRKGNTDRKL